VNEPGEELRAKQLSTGKAAGRKEQQPFDENQLQRHTGNFLKQNIAIDHLKSNSFENE
jgi:hypothetical protein